MNRDLFDKLFAEWARDNPVNHSSATHPDFRCAFYFFFQGTREAAHRSLEIEEVSLADEIEPP